MKNSIFKKCLTSKFFFTQPPGRLDYYRACNTILFLALFVLFFAFSSATASAAVSFRSASSASTASLSTGITHIGTGSPAVSNGCGNITPSIPAGNNNDLLIALAIAKEDDGGNNITMPGWTTYYAATYPGNPPNNNELQVRIFWRYATGSDTNIITQSGASCNAFAGQISRFRGVDTSYPFETATPGVVTQDSNNLDTGSITTTSATAMLLVAGFVSDNRSVSEGTGWSQSFDYSFNAGGSKPDLDVTLNYQLQSTAGNKSISNWSLSGGGTDENFGVIFALKPGGGAASGGMDINVPAGTLANDVMIASISTAPDTTVVSSPSGWTLIRQITQSNTNSSKLSTYYKVASGSEPTSYTWSLSGAGFSGAAGGMASFVGVDTTSPIDAETGVATPSGRDHDAPSVTTTLADGMLVTVHEMATSATWTPPSGMTEIVDAASLTPTDANGISIEMNYEIRATAGATGTKSARSSANAGFSRDFGATQSISLKPYVSSLICFTDNFNRANGSPGTSWVVSNSSGSFGNPVILNNHLRLTDASNNAATMATLQQIFPGAGNRIEVEFDFYDDYGSGADGIAVILSDYSVTPVPGGYGGSLGYAQRTGIPGFAGGWLGVGLDEYGNFSNPTEGRQGGPGFRRDSVSIRGSGSGNTGYSYQAGTAANLNPQVDNNGAAVPPHHYRIIIDHTNGVNAWVSVERNTGSGYVTLIPPYDAKAQPGQATVPTNWILSFTGSTGGSTNVHEIDNLSVCATAQSPVNGSVDHIEFIHDATALTCNPEQVTVKACADASCSSLVSSSVTATLSPSGWLGGDTKTFSGGTATYELKHTVAESVTLNTTSVSPSALNPAVCKDSGGTVISCNIVFSDSGFIFVNDTDSTFTLPSTINTTIPTQLSGKNSNLGYNAKTISLRAVKKGDTDLSQCKPAFQGKTLNVDFAAECINPSSCVAGQLFNLTSGSVTGNLTATTNNNGTTGSNSYDTRSLTFDSEGKVNIVFNYPEAGLIELHARHNLLLADGTTPSGNYISGSTSFVVRPLGFSLSGLSYAANAAGTVFTQAGESFITTLSAVAWQAADDTNNDGIPDAGSTLTDNTITQNFGKESTAVTPANVAATRTTTMPNPGTLSNPANGASFVNGVGSKTLAWDEVGITDLNVSLSNYLSSGDNITGMAQNVGRFNPHHFDTLVSHGCSGSSFTYSGQPFTVTTYARNKAGSTTLNYRDTYAYGVTLSDANPAATPTGSFTNNTIGTASFTSISAADGSSTGVGATSNIQYTFTNKDTIPDTLEIRATDINDTLISSNGFTEGTTEIRSGRMRLENTYGPELSSLSMPVKIEYYSDNTLTGNTADDGFVLNTDDSCTSYDATAGTLSNYTGNLSAGETTVSGAGTIVAGLGTITFSAPGSSNEGSVILLANNVSPWLTYSWNVDCDNADGDNDITTGIDAGLCGPFGLASFGLYRGDDRVIYWKEVF